MQRGQMKIDPKVNGKFLNSRRFVFMLRSLTILCLLLSTLGLRSQDFFTGTWEASADKSPVSVKGTLQIGYPEKKMLYPARLTLTLADKKYSLQFLLVKKDIRRLVIQSKKYLEETINNHSLFFSDLWNGELVFSKNIQNVSFFTSERIPPTEQINPSKIIQKLPVDLQKNALSLFQFFSASDVAWMKKNDSPWTDVVAYQLLQPKQTPAFMGIMDTFYVNSRMGQVHFNKNKDIDIFSVYLNEKAVVDRVDAKKTRDPEDIMLDTGINLLVLFADDFGNKDRSTAGIDVYFDDLKRHLSFRDTLHEGGTVIIQKIYVKYREEEETRFREITENDERLNKSTPIKYLSGGDVGMRLNRKEQVIGRLLSKSAKLTFAIWDDAVEDGDTISLRINNRWIVQGFSVKNRPQFITVDLDAGPNYISFIAENLGSISPNTSVIEIIDGNRRKIYHIDTDMTSNKQVRIFYEVR